MIHYKLVKDEPEESKALVIIKSIAITAAVIISICVIAKLICKKFNISCPVFGCKKCGCDDADFDCDCDDDCEDDCCCDCCDDAPADDTAADTDADNAADEKPADAE